MLSRIPTLVILLVSTALAPATLAQTLYKSTMPDGRIVYSDKPAPGAVKSEEQKVDTSKTGATSSTPRESKALKQMEADRQKREAGGDKIPAAQKALSDAQAAQAAGKEPREGERLGTVGATNRKGGPGGGGAVGGQDSRLTEAYWERQKKLDQAVYDAQKKLEEARK